MFYEFESRLFWVSKNSLDFGLISLIGIVLRSPVLRWNT
jgi:hypothetical protein